MMKSRGPRIEPCGTPVFMSVKLKVIFKYVGKSYRFRRVWQGSASDERRPLMDKPAQPIHLRSTQRAGRTSRPSPAESAMRLEPLRPSEIICSI